MYSFKCHYGVGFSGSCFIFVRIPYSHVNRKTRTFIAQLIKLVLICSSMFSFFFFFVCFKRIVLLRS